MKCPIAVMYYFSLEMAMCYLCQIIAIRIIILNIDQDLMANMKYQKEWTKILKNQKKSLLNVNADLKGIRLIFKCIFKMIALKKLLLLVSIFASKRSREKILKLMVHTIVMAIL